MGQLDLFTGEESRTYASLRSAGDFSPQRLEHYLTALTVLDVAREELGDKLTKQTKGPNYKALCPFHSEKTPSFYVKPEKNLYACYGCGQFGGPLFLAYYLENRSFNDICLQLGLARNELWVGTRMLSDNSEVELSRKVVWEQFLRERWRFFGSPFAGLNPSVARLKC